MVESETSTKRALTVSAQELLAITGELNKSAGRAKTTGHIYLFLTFIIGIWILLLFAFNTELNNAQYNYARAIGARGAEDFKDTIDAINKTAGSDDNIKKELLSIMANRLNPPISNESNFQQMSVVLSGTVVRIGSVLVGIFLIQIMVGFSRYYYRLAEHQRICSIALRLSGGLTADLKFLVPLIMPHIDFGKIPNSPIEKLADSAMRTIGDVAKKIPGR